jgi:hypothetical protein
VTGADVGERLTAVLGRVAAALVELAALLRRCGADVPGELAPPTEPPGWLTVSEAAALHMADMPPAKGRDGVAKRLATARAAVSRACGRGFIRCTGKGRDRRIDPESLPAWRLARREAMLARDDRRDAREAAGWVRVVEPADVAKGRDAAPLRAAH